MERERPWICRLTMKTLVQILLSFLLLPLVAAPAATRERLGFDPEKNIDDVSSMYFAPENSILFRMRNPDGSYREFQRNFDRPNDLWGAQGWRAKIKGDRVIVKSGSLVGGKPLQYEFEKGRLISFSYKGVKHDYAYALTNRLITAGGMPRVFGDEANVKAEKSGKNAKRGNRREKGGAAQLDKKVQRELLKKWAKSGRLRFPFNNPNENGFLYMTLALCSVFLFFYQKKVWKILGGGLFVAACGALVMTASRGSFLALAMGLLPVVALKFKVVLRSKAVWALAAIVLIGAVGWFATHESRLLTRGITTSKWSNQARLEMWATAPKMMAEAPNGWGSMHVGRASMDWYQALDEVSLNGSLVNEHLTKLVSYSRVGRFSYLFVWIALAGLLGYVAWKTREAVAFGLCVAVAVAGWFNPVYDNLLLWIVPILGAILFGITKPWQVCSVKPVGIVLVFSAVCALSVQVGVMVWGSSRGNPRGYPIHVERNRVYVKGLNPQVWIVDDGRMLGGVFACKDIRGYYAYNKVAPSVGYVRRIGDLPKEKVHRLVLAGKSGEAWLKAFGKRIEKEGPAAVKSLPDELVFITPPFPPSAIPEPYLATCRTSLIIGEFAARYEAEYVAPPEWVKIVPGMELYINGWMQHVVGVR